MSCFNQTFPSADIEMTAAENHDDEYVKALEILQDFHRSCSLPCILEDECENFIGDDNHESHFLVIKKMMSRSSVSFDCLSDLVKMNCDNNEMNDDGSIESSVLSKPSHIKFETNAFWDDHIYDNNFKISEKSSICNNSIANTIAENDDDSWSFNHEEKLMNERVEHIATNHRYWNFLRPHSTVKRHSFMNRSFSFRNFFRNNGNNSHCAVTKRIVRKSFVADATRIKKLRPKKRQANSITMKAS